MRDVGKPKAVVAAERIMGRIRGVNVVPHFCRIEEKDVEFYRQFQIIVLGLDSLEARSYINSVICSFIGIVIRYPSFASFGCCKLVRYKLAH